MPLVGSHHLPIFWDKKQRTTTKVTPRASNYENSKKVKNIIDTKNVAFPYPVTSLIGNMFSFVSITNEILWSVFIKCHFLTVYLWFKYLLLDGG